MYVSGMAIGRVLSPLTLVDGDAYTSQKRCRSIASVLGRKTFTFLPFLRHFKINILHGLAFQPDLGPWPLGKQNFAEFRKIEILAGMTFCKPEVRF